MRHSAILAVTLSCALPATAQTADDFFDDRVVHEIRLSVHPSDWQRLRANVQQNTYYPAELRWRGLVAENVGIRSRGGSTRNALKPSLHVDFNRYVSDQEFLGLKSFNLRNLVQDATLIKDRLSMRMFQRMGLAAPRSAHARLYVNEEYIGLFELVESVDKRFLKNHFGEDGGYLYEFDLGVPYHFEYLGPDPSRYSPSPFDPKTHELDPDPQPLVDMIRTINQASDTDFVRLVSEYLDLKLFMTHVAVENFLAEGDGILGGFGMNNFYLYRFRGKKLFQFIAWDKDLTFLWPEYPIWQNTHQNVLMRRALSAPELRQAYLEALKKVAVQAGQQDGWLEQEIAGVHRQIQPAALADSNKVCWQPEGSRVCSNAEFEDAVQTVRLFVRKRADYVLAEIATGGFQVPENAPRLTQGGAVSAASASRAVLAPGSLATLYGTLPGSTAVAGGLPLPTVVGGTSVYINGFQARLQFVSASQLNLQVPWEVKPGVVPITALASGVPGNTITARIGLVSPDIFLVAHANGSVVSQEAPATAGEALMIYATGLGALNLPVRNGEAAPSEPLVHTAERPVVAVQEVEADVLFSGLAPGMAGVYQVNFRMPVGLRGGESVPLVIEIGGLSASVSMPVRQSLLDSPSEN